MDRGPQLLLVNLTKPHMEEASKLLLARCSIHDGSRYSPNRSGSPCRFL